MTAYIDKRIFANSIGSINKLHNGANTKSTPDVRIQLDIVVMGILRRIRLSCFDALSISGRSVIDRKTIMKAVRELTTPETNTDAELAIENAVIAYARNMQNHQNNNQLSSLNTNSLANNQPHTRQSHRIAAGLIISPSVCKKIIGVVIPSIKVTIIASIAIAAFIEYVISLFIKAAGNLEEFGSIITTSRFVMAIGRDGILRDFVIKNGIYFCGVGVATLSMHGEIIPLSEKLIISNKKRRRIVFSILGQPLNGPIIYKLSESAINDLFSFVETRVINLLRDTVELVSKLRGKKYITPVHIRCVAEVKGIIIRDPLSPIRRHTAEHFLKIAGSDAVAKIKDGDTIENIVSSLIEAECINILNKSIISMDHNSRTIIKPKFIREGGLNSGFIICSYVRPQKE